MRPRARAALGLAAWLVATLVALLVAGAAIRGLGVGTLGAYAVLDLALLVVSFAVWRAVDARHLRETPLAPDRRAVRDFFRGAGIGALLLALVVAILALVGAYRLAPRACAVEPLARFLAWTGAFVLLASLFEEALFRGYGLFAIRGLSGGVAAAVVTGLLFALGHRANPGFGPWAVASLAIVGAVLAAWVLRERSVWPAVGAHAGWNAALVAGAAVPVSGLALPAPCHAGILSGPDWLTGGAFGIEPGVATATVWILFGGWRLRTGRRRGAGAR